MENLLEYFYYRSGLRLSLRELSSFCNKGERDIQNILQELLTKSPAVQSTGLFTLPETGKRSYMENGNSFSKNRKELIS